MYVSSTDQQEDGERSMSKTSSMNVKTSDPNDIARILQLSGLQNDAAAIEVDSCEDDCDMQPEYGSTDVVVAEQQAEYDYGNRDVDDDQEKFDIKDYNWKGRADLPERFVSHTSGSNPLVSQVKEDVYNKLLTAYKEFLEESSDIDDSAGLLSPLTANSRDEFDKDPFSEDDKDSITDGSKSPLSTVKRQRIPR